MTSWKTCATSAGLVAALILTIVSTALSAELKVVVKPQVVVQGDAVLLKDLAVITGPDGAFKNDLSAVNITRAPEPGKQVKIRQNYLIGRLRATGLPLEMAEWSLPEEIVVTRTHQELDEAWLRRVVEDYLAGEEPYASSDWKLVTVRAGNLPKPPAGQLEYRVAPNTSTNPGSISLTIYLSVDGQEVDKIRVTGKVDMSMQALVAARPLERNAVIRPEDVRIESVNLSQLRSGAVTEPAKAEGLSIRRNIQAGQPILSKDLYRRDVVRQGEMVTIVAQSGPLKITARGLAKQAGAIGDTITVTNTASNKNVSARVVNASTVEVTF